MKKYMDFETEDFLMDDFFVNSVLHPDESNTAFWLEWTALNPHRKEILDRAWLIASSIQVKPSGHELTSEELVVLSDDLENKIANTVDQPFTLRSFTHSPWFKIAAVILVLLICSLSYYSFYRQSFKKQHLTSSIRIKANSSNRTMVVLIPDSSIALLRPGSSIKFSERFKGNTRDVFLEGEAFFEVKKNPSKPFLVHSHNLITKVLGTSFLVSSYSDSSAFKVLVNTGKVLVYVSDNRSKEKKQSIALVADQMATFERAVRKLQKSIVNLPSALSTHKAKKEFDFSEVPVTEVLQKIEAAYGIDIIYDKDKLAQLSLNSTLSDLDLEQKISIICRSINARYSLQDGQFKIETN